MKHVDPKQIQMWLDECGGNEDHDDFRVRVRGLPRKSAKDSIINLELVEQAITKGRDFEIEKVSLLPVILTCDPAWRGDETTIWFRQGNYARLLEKYRLDAGQDHMFTYLKLCHWERELGADAVFIDQGEGTAIKTLANNAGKSWELISFAGSPNDTPEFKDSQYANIRAQMYYQAAEWLRKEGGVLASREEQWEEEIKKQLCWTKGGQHKINLKKLAEPKADIKTRVGQSPDIADGFVLAFARHVPERLPENDRYADPMNRTTGGGAYQMPEHGSPYGDTDYDPYN